MADDWVDVPPIGGAPPAPASDGWEDVPPVGGAKSIPRPEVPISGPQGWSTAAKGVVNSTSVGSVMRAFGEGFGEAWGPERLGLSKESTKWLADKGIFAPGKNYDNPFQAFNEGVIVNAAGMFDAAVRTASGVFRGGQAATMEALGGGPLGREIASIPEAFMGSPGALGEIKMRPGLPKDVPEGIAAERAPAVEAATAATESAPPPVNKVAQAVADAQDLGVIGEPKPPITEGSPKDAAKAVTTMAAEGPKGEKVTQELPGEVDAWQQRFNKFVGKLDKPEDIKQFILDSAKDNDGFEAARQGNIPLSQVDSVAQAAGVDASEISQSGLGRLLKNDLAVQRTIQYMLDATDRFKEAAAEVKANDSPESLIKLQEAIMRRDLAVEQVVGVRAEWGRTGNVINSFLRDVKDQETLNKFLKDKGRSPDDLRAIADGVDGLDRGQAARFMSDMRTPTAWDKFRYYWINALISGPVTHTKYIVANAAYAGYESAVVTPAAGIVGAVRRGLKGDVEGVYMGEAAARTWGIIAGVPDAMKAAASAVKSGLQTPLPGEIAQNIIPKQNKNIFFQQKPIGGALGTVIGAPSRVASGIHSFFNFLGYRASMEAQAYRQAAKEGLKPGPSGPPPVPSGMIRFYHGEKGQAPTEGGPRWFTPQEDYARNFRTVGGEENTVHYVDVSKDEAIKHGGYNEINNYPQHFEAPESIAKQAKPLKPETTGDSFWQRRQAIVDKPTVDMMNSAIEEGYKLTYISELGESGKKLSAFVNSTKVGQLVMPFTHIPLKILHAAIEGTPAAFLDPEARADLQGANGAVKQDMAVARMVVGSAVGVWAMNQVLNERMTGFGPTDPKERAQWLATGHQPYSIRIGDYWYSFNRFGSLGTMLGLYSNLSEVIPHLKPDTEELTKAIAMTVHSTGRLMEDEVGMQGLAGLMSAIDEPDRKGAKFVSNFAGSLLPFSSMQRQVASAMDPYMRETKTVVDGLRYYIPVAREGLLPKRDWSGLPISNAGYGGDVPGISELIQHRYAVPNPIALEMQALDLHPAPPQDRINGVKLPPKIYDAYQTTAGAFTREALQHYIDMPNWHELPPFVRESMFKATIEGARKSAGAVTQMQFPQIIQQGVDDKVAKINGQKPTKLKDSAAPAKSSAPAVTEENIQGLGARG